LKKSDLLYEKIRITIVTCLLKARVVKPKKTSVARQWVGKHDPVETNMCTTTEELLKVVFSMRSMVSYIWRTSGNRTGVLLKAFREVRQ
jgi:hypothetical protein